MELGEYYGQKAVYRKIGRGRMNGILALAGDLNNKSVLDVGCGGGELGKELKAKFPSVKVYGVDISPEAVREASKHLDGAEVLDLTAPWPENLFNTNFDLIVISEVLEHLFKPEELLLKIKDKFTSPVIITVPNVLFWKNRLNILLGHFTYTNTGLMDRGHIHFFSWPTFKDLITSTGFKITGTHHHAPTRVLGWFKNIFPGLVSYQFIVKIIKD